MYAIRSYYGVVERKQGRGYAVLRCAGAVAVASGVAAVEPLPLLSLPTWERISYNFV